MAEKLSWEDFKDLKGHDKKDYFLKDGKIFHVILPQQFDRNYLDDLCDLTTKIKKIDATITGRRFLKSLLNDKEAILYFTQPSTRTYLSFNTACDKLGITHGGVRDAKMSSEMKGESPEDSVITASQYCDLIIMRSPIEDLAEKMAFKMNSSKQQTPIINAGSGKDQHPTQALLDVYTWGQAFNDYEGIDGTSIAFVGDLKRGRTVRSLAYLMKNYKDVCLYFVAPKELQVEPDLKVYLREHEIPFEEHDSLEDVISKVDVVYMTRIQDEYDSGGESIQIDYDKFRFKPEYLAKIKSSTVIMHPLPRRKTQELPEIIDDDRRAIYWEQTKNGMFVRMALISSIFGKDNDILNY